MANNEETPIRLAILAENRFMREALSASLASRPGLLVVGTTSTREELETVCATHRPHIVLVDAVTLLLAVDALREVHASSPGTDVVAIASVDLTTAQLVAVARGGVSALVSDSEGLDAVLRVFRRRAGAVVRQVPGGPQLTPREARIVYLMGAGHSTPELAKLLELRPRTVENHKRHIYAKLGVSSQSHAVARAISLGLLDVPLEPRPGVEAGRSTLVVVHGPGGDCRDEVMLSLVTQGLPFVVIQTRQPVTHDHWARWHRGAVTVVLIDPEPEDWSLSTSLGAATVVVRCSGMRDQTAIIDAIAHGANGLVFRDDVAVDLGPILTLVSHGHFAMSGVYAAALGKLAPAQATTVPQLTAREHDILGSIASGHTIRQTARALGIAVKTVENTQARLFRKLGARNRTETLTIADAMGLVDRADLAHGPVVHAVKEKSHP